MSNPWSLNVHSIIYENTFIALTRPEQVSFRHILAKFVEELYVKIDCKIKIITLK